MDTPAHWAGGSVIFRVMVEYTWQMSSTDHISNYKESHSPIFNPIGKPAFPCGALLSVDDRWSLKKHNIGIPTENLHKQEQSFISTV